MKKHYPLVVIGTGPAGMAAARCAAQQGIDTLVLDQQQHPGGQIYRGTEHNNLPDPSLLGNDYRHGKSLINTFRQSLIDSRVDYKAQATVWSLDKISPTQCELGVLIDSLNHFIRADRVLIAIGAQERPMPLPGWQLPGVMSAGAGQILLKSAALVPDNGVVLAGSGPLLILLAWQYLRAGVKVRALLDTQAAGALRTALPLLPRAVLAYDYLLKGASMLLALRRARVPIYKHVTAITAEGDQCLHSVRFKTEGAWQSIETDTLLLHQGVIPNLHLPLAAGCDAQWHQQQYCWQLQTDEWGQSSVESILLAGDGGSVVGARAAALQGQIAALHAAYTLGAITQKQRDRDVVALRKSLGRHTAIRAFLDALYRPLPHFIQPVDETIICRCEEISAAEIRAVARLGCPGPNQAKAFTRCGMGPCQGRQCGNTVAELIAEVRGVSMEKMDYYRARPPISPITLGQLAGDISAFGGI